MSELLEEALRSAYKDLKPYSDKHAHDFKRYLFSLETIAGIPGFAGKKLLDIGTGVGIMPLALKKLGMNAVGADYYIFPEVGDARFGIAGMDDLSELWKKCGLVVHRYDLLDPSMTEKIGPVDVVLSEATLEHLKDPKRFLDNCSKLLSPHGYLLVTTPNIATLLKRIRFLFGKSPLWPVEDFYHSGEKFTGHWREYTMQELIFMCREAGLSVQMHNTRNVLAKWKHVRNWRKNIRVLVAALSAPFESMREIHYILCQKR